MRKSPTKEEYSKVFNKILGTDIDWARLKLEDLIQLGTLFNHPEIFLSKLGVELKKEMGRKRLVEIGIDFLEEIANKWEGPLAQLFKKAMKKESGK